MKRRIERRKHMRFQATKGAYAVLWSEADKLSQIKDISRGGLSFCEELKQRVKNSGKETLEHKGGYSWFYAVLLVTIFLIFKVSVVKGTEMDDPLSKTRKIGPPDVFLAAQNTNKDLELLRRHMGAPKSTLLNIRIQNAAPHDVYFQALTMFQKANRLSFEITRLREEPPPLPMQAILPVHVLALVKRAHLNIQRVMTELNVPKNNIRPIRDERKTPTDVFKTIMTANRQLNLLLERRFAPSDVYKVVTLAIGYADRQLSQFSGVNRIPDDPPFEREKTPSNVYFRLLECLDIIAHIYDAANLAAFEIDAVNINARNITPSDVFDIASLIVARLDILHRHFDLSKLPMGAFYPGRKYPSDVYQQAGILKEQLKQIEYFITAPAGN